MFVCSPHASDDPVASRPGRPPSQVEGARCNGGHVAVRLSSAGNSRHRGAPDRRRVAGAACDTSPGEAAHRTGEGYSRRARRALIVVDASAVVEVLLQTSAAGALMDRFFGDGETLHAPHLLDVEVAQMLRRYARTGSLSSGRGAEALQDLADFPIARYPHQPFLARIWALRHNVTAYDAAYLALAEALSAPLVTRDSRLASAPGHEARIELL